MILSIDTTTTVCSVALHRDTTLLGCYELFTERTSAAMLTTLIKNVVKHTGHELAQLDAIAVAKGPGSYTGLRIGVSTAKGLCFALNKSLIAINSLHALAEQIRPHLSLRITHSSLTFCPLLDARRMEVYCALYDREGQELRATSAEIITEDSFADVLANYQVLFFGDGAAKCRPVLEHNPNALFLEQTIQPSARTVGVLASAAYAASQFEDVATFEPYYLKEFMTTVPKRVM